MKIKPSRQHIRFGLVGVVNTLTDVGLYAILLTAGLVPVLVANTVSTSCGMLISYVLNRHFTFRSGGKSTKHQVVRFLVVTLAGLWILQPIVIYAIRDVVGGTLDVSKSDVALNVFAKLVATGASLIWNYFWYSRFVFVAAEPKGTATRK